MECAVLETEKLKFLKMLVTFKLLTSVSSAEGGSGLSRCVLFFLHIRGVSKSEEKQGNCFLQMTENNTVKLKLAYAGVQVKVGNFIVTFLQRKVGGRKVHKLDDKQVRFGEKEGEVKRSSWCVMPVSSELINLSNTEPVSLLFSGREWLHTKSPEKEFLLKCI